MESTEWSLAAAFDVVAAAAPDRDMLVWKHTRRTYAEVARRTRNLAAFFQRRGIGLRRERAGLERWECGQAPVALLLYNCPEYIEAMLGCFRARAVPFNADVAVEDEAKEVAALVVSGADPESLADAARERLSSFKVPTLWLVVPDPESVPMSATGKVDKSALQQLLLSRGKRRWR